MHAGTRLAFTLDDAGDGVVPAAGQGRPPCHLPTSGRSELAMVPDAIYRRMRHDQFQKNAVLDLISLSSSAQENACNLY